MNKQYQNLKDREVLILKLAVVVSLLIVVGANIFMWFYVTSDVEPITGYEVEIDCLVDYAEDYCDGDFHSIDGKIFSCVLEQRQRTGYIELRKYHFTDREIRDCTVIELNPEVSK